MRCARLFTMHSQTGGFELSVIVPAYNEGKRIAGTLTSLSQYLAAQRIPFEIIVVDDGPEDGTSAVVRALGS